MLTPEEIIALIGNIANRPDLREIQERQVKEIKALVDKYVVALIEIKEECPHWGLCSALWFEGYPRNKPDYSKCDCHRKIASNALGIYE